jgi:hypothetical protein
LKGDVTDGKSDIRNDHVIGWLYKCIRAGLADELHIDIMPVLLGGGLRLFEDTGLEPCQLERLKVSELPAGRTNLQFRFLRDQTGNQTKRHLE